MVNITERFLKTGVAMFARDASERIPIGAVPQVFGLVRSRLINSFQVSSRVAAIIGSSSLSERSLPERQEFYRWKPSLPKGCKKNKQKHPTDFFPLEDDDFCGLLFYETFPGSYKDISV